MTSVLVDTGFLVSLFRPADRLRAQAREFLLENRHPLATVAPAMVDMLMAGLRANPPRLGGQVTAPT